jgi:hypothetical protein
LDVHADSDPYRDVDAHGHGDKYADQYTYPHA